MEERRYHMGAISGDIKEWLKGQEEKLVPVEADMPAEIFQDPVKIKKSWLLIISLSGIILIFALFIGMTVYNILFFNQGGKKKVIYPFYQKLTQWNNSKIIQNKSGVVVLPKEKSGSNHVPLSPPAVEAAATSQDKRENVTSSVSSGTKENTAEVAGDEKVDAPPSPGFMIR